MCVGGAQISSTHARRSKTRKKKIEERSELKDDNACESAQYGENGSAIEERENHMNTREHRLTW
jgi:hypothetical protein